MNAPNNTGTELTKAINQQVDKHYGHGDLEDWIDEATDAVFNSVVCSASYMEIYEEIEARYWAVHDSDHLGGI